MDGVTRMMHERLRYLNETLNIALDNYANPSFSNRTKRGLINGLGQGRAETIGGAGAQKFKRGTWSMNLRKDTKAYLTITG